MPETDRHTDSDDFTVQVKAQGYEEAGDAVRAHIDEVVSVTQRVLGLQLDSDEAQRRLSESVQRIGAALDEARVQVAEAEDDEADDRPQAGDLVRVEFEKKSESWAFGVVTEVLTEGSHQRGNEVWSATPDRPLYRVDLMRPDDDEDGEWERTGAQTLHRWPQPLDEHSLAGMEDRSGTIYETVTVGEDGAGYRFGYCGTIRALPAKTPEPLDPREGMGQRFQVGEASPRSQQIEPPEIGEFRTTVPMQAGFAATDGDEQRIDIPINTDDHDRHGTVIEPGGAELEAYRMNPVVLINHNRSLVAGTSTVEKRDGKLVATMGESRWDDEDPDIAKWHRKVQQKIVRAASIGFRVQEYREEKDEEHGRYFRITKWELVEWSWVSVPSNPNAVAGRSSADLAADLNRRFEQLADSITEGLREAFDRDPIQESANEQVETNGQQADPSTNGEQQQADDEQQHVVSLSEIRRRKREIAEKRKAKAEKIAKRRKGQR